MSEPVPEGMGRCEVTGNVVPEDELVVIRGKRVSAEGKAILLDRLSSGEGAPGELERASFWGRIFSWMLDNALILILYYSLLFAFSIPTATVGLNVSFGFKVLSFVFSIVTILYFGVMHGLKGQSIGKMAMKIKVVRIDGKPMDLGTGLLRAVTMEAVGIVGAFVMFTDMTVLVTVIGVIELIYYLMNAIVTFADGNGQRSIHDRVAGTRVITIES